MRRFFVALVAFVLSAGCSLLAIELMGRAGR